MKDKLIFASILTVYALVAYGFFANIYKLTQNDFEAPVKEEVIRTVGILVPPMGVVLGYLELNPNE